MLCPLLLIAPLAHSQQPPAHTQQPRRDTVILHFGFDRFAVEPTYDSVALNHYFNSPDFNRKYIDSVYITGYTDTIGTDAYNRKLSDRRAFAASRWLDAELANTTRHPPRTHIPQLDIALGKGKAHTLQLSDSANRRAEIVIYYHVDPALAAAPANPDAPTHPADTAVALHRDSTQPTAVISLPINFVVDTPVPTDATQLTLPRYVDQLRKYADHRMEIDGFCNSLGPLSGADDPLFKLSVNRAKFIYDYLIKAGFDPAKLTYKGMGNASPVNPDPVTRQQMDANMRVEIKVY
jgi:outer membrane protein OmpA-like peptidoglycan-associated protein